MKLFLTSQQSHFPQHLRELEQKNVMPYDRSELVEKITAFSFETTRLLKDIDTRFLFGYQLFPEQILAGFTEWVYEGRPMKVGDTIVQQICLPPVKRFSVKAVFGVRICEIIDEPTRTGFSYETLEGHVERGISAFLLEQSEGKIVFTVYTFSKPGTG